MPPKTPLTVGHFLEFAEVKLWKWAARLRKQGDREAFMRLGPLRKNLERIRGKLDAESSDPSMLRRLKNELLQEFTDELFRHQTLKAIDTYLNTGRKTRAAVTEDDDKTASQRPVVELIEEKPATPESQKQAKHLLKESKIVKRPLTAEVAAEIYETLAKTDAKLADAFAADVAGSFKSAVPGNLGDNTKPSTPASQKQAVELLKQGGILPAGEKASDYPVLTAAPQKWPPPGVDKQLADRWLQGRMRSYRGMDRKQAMLRAINDWYAQEAMEKKHRGLTADVKREIIATLLKQKEPKLATWAAQLPVHVTAFKEEELFLWNVRVHKPSYRKPEWENLRRDAKALRKFDDVAVDLVKQGLFKRSKNGALLLTQKGKQATMALPRELGPGRFPSPQQLRGSFKGAVPGNLGDNTKPSTPASQKHAVELLKQGGILPADEKASDYPVLTAGVKRDVIVTLLQRKQPKLATWASSNLVVAYPPPKTKKPSIKTMQKWMDDGVAKATDGCRVEPDGTCPHGHPSWLIRLGLI